MASDEEISIIKGSVSELVRKRGYCKRKITFILNKFKQLKSINKLNDTLFKSQFKIIEEQIAEIKSFDREIVILFEKHDLEESEPTFVFAEVEGQVEYHFSLEMELTDFKEYLEIKKDEVPKSNDSVNNSQFLEALGQASFNEPKPPPLECGYFEGNDKDKFEFHVFLAQFNNLIDSKNYSNKIKLSYLHTYLKGYAKKLIGHLSLQDENYPIAINLLKEQFLDVPLIIDEIFKRLLELSPPAGYDHEFKGVKTYINDVRTYVFDLKVYEVDFLEEKSAGNIFLSHIIFNKLPISFKREIIHRVNTNYPNLTHIFDNYIEVVKTLTKTSKGEKTKSVFNKSKIANDTKLKNIANDTKLKNNSTLQNFKTDSIETGDNKNSVNTKTKINPSTSNKSNGNIGSFKPCKFCQVSGHSMTNCNKFVTLEERIKRAKELNLCPKCSGVGHVEADCFGNSNRLKNGCYFCKSHSHIAAFCDSRPSPNQVVNSLCITYQQRSDMVYLLPTLTIEIVRGGKVKRARCLCDTGSQRSYISKNIAKELCADLTQLHDIPFDVQTFIGTEQRSFKQIPLGIKICDQNTITMPLLVDDNLKLKYNITGLDFALGNLKSNYKLADSSFYNNNSSVFEIEVLLGIDILQFFPSFQLSPCMNGSCFTMGDKIIPFGHVEHFLKEEQLTNFYQQGNQNVHNTTRVSSVQSIQKANTSREVHETIVNTVISPVKSYFNPLESILTDSDVENGLEYLFSLESMGVASNDDTLNDYDSEMVEKFKKGIIFKHGKYMVQLPWIREKIDLVPSNYYIANKVLHRVVSFLKNKGLLEEYDAIFQKQLADGIIEQIEVPLNKIENYVFVPHRPVLRQEAQVTTKIRPVLNCSLKTNKSIPSLNEASYTGIDLINSLLKLLFIFRTNSYVVLGDIKQAFLMIGLWDEFDQNKFCLLWQKEDKLVIYRYKTIVFGYTASPFILHFVMKTHAEKFPVDKCSQILSSNFYVDNLLFTGNEIEELKNLYRLTYERMAMGGFILRSWNSNCKELRKIMTEDGRLVEHDCEEEKVLGYRFNTSKDTIHIAKVDYNASANSKRIILSETSKVFDPLGLALPLTIRGRLLVRTLWERKYEWDEQLPPDAIDEWEKLGNDLAEVHKIEYPRQVLSEKLTYGMHVFCDSSKDAFGFVTYGCTDQNESSMLYAKAKVAPVNNRGSYSIPTLEFLSVILALKCLATVLNAYNNIHFKFVNICVDSQVVLNWMLTKETKLKSKYVKNRIRDFLSLIDEVKNTFKIPMHFSYVNTLKNPADLVSRGVTFKKFNEIIKFWLNGPDFLSNDLSMWPKYPLLSVATDVKHLTIVNLGINEDCNLIPIFDITKFSSFEKIINITMYLFKPFCIKKKLNARNKALIYWFRLMQNEHFSSEIAFLLDSSNGIQSKRIPSLVSNLNLFLDKDGLLRSSGRISKSLYFNYDVHHPILLSKFHYLTKLYIQSCHTKMQHLGLATTLNYIRSQGFWIPQARSAVKNIIKECISCKKMNVFAFRYPKYSSMPKHHLNLIYPFRHVGVDFTGHLWVNNPKTNASEKVFILIFTCLNIRAIHIEVLPDMTVKNFVLAFQRFCNRYTVPQYLYCDNAKTFTKGSDVLNKSLRSNEFGEELAQNNISLIQIPYFSGWVGSAWERLIRVLKNCLYKVVGRSKLTYFELLTTLSNIQNAINSRPLTYISNSDPLQPLSPNSFLKLHSNSSLILREESNDPWVDRGSQDRLELTLTNSEKLYESFRNLWHESYLLSLREHSRDLYQTSWENKIKAGDVVLIKSPVKPRPFWLLGKVLEVTLGYDDKIRSVKIKQANGITAQHSISNLYPLELSILNERKAPVTEDTKEQENEAAPPNLNITNSRPKRKAALKCDEFLKQYSSKYSE